VIAANGGSTAIGLNGGDTGQDPSPIVFTLNGTVCGDD
jgi:hypothetical protein